MKLHFFSRNRVASLCAGVAIPLCAFSGSVSAQDDVLKVFLLLGQSNMEGQAYTYTTAQTDTWNITTMQFLLSGSPAATTYLANMTHGFKDSFDASWLDPRDDVWCVQYHSATGNARNVLATTNPADLYNGIGPLSPGFGVGTNFGSMIGLELAMGIRLAESTGSPFFLFKSNKGGTTLGNDWRPPTAVDKRGGSVGVNFTNSMQRFGEFLDALDADLADDGKLNGYGDAVAYEVSGVVWFQGWNEQFDDAPYSSGQLQAEYADNLRDLIYSIRAADARIPNDLGLIIGESSDQNATLNTARLAAVDALNGEIPMSAAYFDSDDTKGSNWGNNDSGTAFSDSWGFHFNARAENFLELGWRAAGAVLDSEFLGVSPPRLSPTGGEIEGGATVTVRSAEPVYYTTDGSDPRLPDGEINPAALMLPADLGGAPVPVTVFARNADWRYLHDGSDLGASDIVDGHESYGAVNWKHPEFDDAAWSGEAAGIFGFGSISGATANTPLDRGFVTYYFRKTVNLPDADRMLTLDCEVLRDDAVIIYINGREAGRSNIGEGPQTAASVASSSVTGAAESTYNPISLDPALLVSGDNLIAVELHQDRSGSSDVAFDMELYGTAEAEGVGFDILSTTQIIARARNANGDWSEPTNASYVVDEQTFTSWMEENFTIGELADVDLSGPDVDRRGDRVTVLLAYAFGLDPKSAADGGLPQPVLVPAGEERYLALTFRRRNDASDLVYRVLVSGDLASWSETLATVGEPVDNGDGTETVTFRDTLPAPAGLRRFIHLEVTVAGE